MPKLAIFKWAIFFFENSKIFGFRCKNLQFIKKNNNFVSNFGKKNHSCNYGVLTLKLYMKMSVHLGLIFPILQLKEVPSFQNWITTQKRSSMQCSNQNKFDYNWHGKKLKCIWKRKKIEINKYQKKITSSFVSR